jgi:hypothetical protein
MPRGITRKKAQTFVPGLDFWICACGFEITSKDARQSKIIHRLHKKTCPGIPKLSADERRIKNQKKMKQMGNLLSGVPSSAQAYGLTMWGGQVGDLEVIVGKKKGGHEPMVNITEYGQHYEEEEPTCPLGYGTWKKAVAKHEHAHAEFDMGPAPGDIGHPAEEPCDRCPSDSMLYCQSNGCPDWIDEVTEDADEGCIGSRYDYDAEVDN